MTRRYLIYKDKGKIYISQEFNGDKEEHLYWNADTPLKANWGEVINLFNKTTDTLFHFRQTVRTVEEWYGYECVPLKIVDVMPNSEEVWIFSEGILKLYSKY